MKLKSRIDKEYSYLLAFALGFFVAWQSVDISFKLDKSSDMQLNIVTHQINPLIFVPCVSLIAAIFGIPFMTKNN